jgi:RHO1 GDP-GTP exchange protein 1/2
MYSYPMEALNPDDGQGAGHKRGRKICHANFFKAGICQGQQLVCCVKTSALSTTIKVYEPMDSMAKKTKKSGLAKMLANTQDVLKPLKVRPSFAYFFIATDFAIGILHPH